MTLEEIRNNAPEGATHYRIINNNVEYIKKDYYWYLWFSSRQYWMTTFWNRHEDTGLIPLT